jgi:Domain of unknown function (DUF4340)
VATAQGLIPAMFRFARMFSALGTMKSAWIVNLLLLAGVVGLVVFAIYRPKEEQAPQFRISSLSPAQVQHVLIEPKGGTTIELEKRGETWFLLRPYAARADRTQVERLLDLVSVSSKEKLAAIDLPRFDLDDPKLRVTFNQQTIGFGASNPLSQDQYVLSGDGVYLLSTFYTSLVPQRAERLLTHSLFRENEKPTAFKVKDFQLAQQDGKWQLTPAPASEQEKASQDEINRWVEEWRFASSLLTQPATGKTPIETIEVKLADGNTLKLGVVEKTPELVLLRPDEKLQYHFSGEAGRRLISRPVAAPQASESAAPASANSAVKTP